MLSATEKEVKQGGKSERHRRDRRGDNQLGAGAGRQCTRRNKGVESERGQGVGSTVTGRGGTWFALSTWLLVPLLWVTDATAEMLSSPSYLCRSLAGKFHSLLSLLASPSSHRIETETGGREVLPHTQVQFKA